jgi:tetratricopeptide (TPR) repeat protein
VIVSILALVFAGAGLGRAAESPDLAAIQKLAAASRWAAAESLSAATVIRIERTPPADSLLLAQVLAAYSNARWMQRKIADARAIDAIERAIGIRARREGPDQVPSGWHALAGRILRNQGRLDGALDHARGAVALASRGPEPRDSLEIDARRLLASVYRFRLEFSAAIAQYETTLVIADRSYGANGLRTAEVLTDFGGTLKEAAQVDRARAILQRAIRIYEQHPGAMLGSYAVTLNHLSGLERDEGNLAESMDLMRRACEVSSRNVGENAFETALYKVNLAIRLILLDDNAGAAELLRQCVPTFSAHYGATHENTLQIRTTLANALANAGDTTGAFAQLDSVDAGFRARSGPRSTEQSFAGTARASLLIARGRTLAARALLNALFPLETDSTDTDGGRRGEICEKLFDTCRGHADAATMDSTLQRLASLEAGTAVRRTSYWLPVLTSRALAEGRLGRADAAWTDALEAERLARLHLELNAQALPDRRALGLQSLVGQPLDLVLAFARSDDPAQVRTAWDRLVRWRGLVRDVVAARRRPLAAGADTALIGAHDRWVAAQRRYARLVVSESTEPAPDRLEAARLEAEEAERRWTHALGPRAPHRDSVSLAAVLARLPKGEALFSYAQVRVGTEEPRLMAFVGTSGDEPRLLDLGAVRTIESRVLPWRAAIASSPRAGYVGEETAERESRLLGELARSSVWDPLVRLAPGASQIDVVGDGVVADLPWLAFPGEGPKYLAESAITVRALGSERELLRAPTAPTGAGLLAMGDPDFGAAQGAPPLAAATRGNVTHCVRLRPLTMAPLPGARIEAQEAAGLWHTKGGKNPGVATLLLGSAATEEAFRRQAGGRRVIHLATYGVVVDDSCGTAAAGTRVGGVSAVSASPSDATPIARPVKANAPSGLLPRRVWVAFAGAGASTPPADEGNDGLLTAEEVTTLDLRGVEWVVLSACHSAAGESWPHEEALGMERAFHLAGARSVIASSWAVDDASTREWMRALYSARQAQGGDAAIAAGAADRVVLAERRKSKRTTHPFYWAAFTTHGE